MKHIRALLACAALLTLLGACVARNVAEPVDTSLSLGVASFSQPVRIEDLLAGYIPPGGETAPTQELQALDGFLAAELGREGRAFIDAGVVAPCVGQADAQAAETPGSALDYWVRVGQCAGVDYLLVPQVLYWKERQGSSVGVTEPASVVLDLYVVDVREYGLVTRYHFEEAQTSLSENLLTLPSFLSRQGQWISAQELATEAVAQGLRQIGL